MELKAIIFDVDGTLAETEELHREAFNKTFREWKLAWHWDTVIYTKLLKVSGGKERIHYYAKLFPDRSRLLEKKEINLIHQKKTKYYSKSLGENKLQLRSGVSSVIEEARRRNIKLAIATATSRKNVEALVKTIWKVQIQDIFSAVATGDDVSQNKPCSEIYHLVLKKLQIQAKHCIAIEDSLNGLMSAKGAGINTIITPSFYTKEEDFSQAETVLESLTEFKF